MARSLVTRDASIGILQSEAEAAPSAATFSRSSRGRQVVGSRRRARPAPYRAIPFIAVGSLRVAAGRAVRACIAPTSTGRRASCASIDASRAACSRRAARPSGRFGRFRCVRSCSTRSTRCLARIDTQVLLPAASRRLHRHRTVPPPPVDAVLRAAGLDHRRIYDCRHTFATWAIESGCSPVAPRHDHGGPRLCS